MNSKIPQKQISPQRKVMNMFEPWKRFGSESSNAQTLWGRASRPATSTNIMAHPTRGYLSNCEQTIFENPRPATAPVQRENSRQNTLVQALINNIDKFILRDKKESNLKMHQDEIKRAKETNPFYKIKQEYVTWNSVNLNSNKNEIKESDNTINSNKKELDVLSKFKEVNTQSPTEINSQENHLIKNPFTCSDMLKPRSINLQSKPHTLLENHGDCKQAVVKKPQSRHLCRHCRLRYAVESSEVDDEIEPVSKNSFRKRYRKSNAKQSCHKERSRNKDVETPHLIKNKKSHSPIKRSKSVSSKCSDSSSYKTTVSTASKTRLLQEIGSESELDWTTSEIDLVQKNSLTLPRETRRATIVMLNNRRSRPTKVKQSHVDILEDKNYLINETLLQTVAKTTRICPYNLLCTKPACHHRVPTDDTTSSSISEDSSSANSLALFKIANSIHPYCSLMLKSTNHTAMAPNVSNGNKELVNFNNKEEQI